MLNTTFELKENGDIIEVIHPNGTRQNVDISELHDYTEGIKRSECQQGLRILEDQVKDAFEILVVALKKLDMLETLKARENHD